MLLTDQQQQTTTPRLQTARQQLARATAANNKRLNRPLTRWRSLIAELNLLAAKIRGHSPAATLEPAALEDAADIFPRLFPATLKEMVTEALEDPGGYQKKIDAYEDGPQGAPLVPFDTENDHYRLIVKDPLRIREEHFLYRTVLQNSMLNNSHFRFLDLGTGSGRLALSLASELMECCPDGTFSIYGLDLNPGNIRDALSSKAREGFGDQVKFVRGDMTATPFADNSFDLCNASSSTYLVPFYRRPFHLLEMARILTTGGEGVITGPNEQFSAAAYARCMAATNLETYLHPGNMLLAQKLGPVGLLIDRLSCLRVDFTIPDNQGLSEALKCLGCDIIEARSWPEEGTTPIYSGIRFRTSDTTRSRLRRYSAYMEQRNQAAGITTM